MATEQAPFTVDIDWLVREVQQFGYGRTDPPGLNERRLFYENGNFILKIWNGITWEVIGPFVRIDCDSTVNSNTKWKTGKMAKFGDNGEAAIQVHTNGGFYMSSSANMAIWANAAGGKIYLRVNDNNGVNIYMMTLDGGAKKVDITADMAVTGQISVNGNPVLVGDTPNSSTISSRTISNKSISNGSYEDTQIPAGTAGIFMLKNETDGVTGYFTLCCTSTTSVMWTMGNSGGAYFFYNDTPGKMCVFFLNGTLQIRNRTGTSKTISAGLFSIE